MSGHPYRALHARDSVQWRAPDCRHDQAIALTATLDWPEFWQRVSFELLRHDYLRNTRAQYRAVLRGFYRYARRQPADTDESLIHRYVASLAEANYSWSWLGMNISILRNVFDKLAGGSIVQRFITPKRPFPLPEILSGDEIRQVLAAAPSTRDQLLLGLLYGCGLKVGELCRLRWQDVDLAAQRLVVHYGHHRERRLEIPPDLLPVLGMGTQRCSPRDYIFQGRIERRHLSPRMIELIVRKARHAAGILKPVTAMTLRHAYAVHCIEAGDSIRAVQEALGHRSIETTLLYRRCILPDGVVSPFDRLRQRQRQPEPSVPESPSPSEPHSEFRVPSSLFTEPPSLEAIELPFRDETSGLAAGFYQMLKTQILGRFLCLRRATSRTG
jgi:integrase